jgi:LmbE family N-acetylglucosaminyl deacetylase
MTFKKKKNVIAIGAHPDDVEIGCAGTLARHVDEGDAVTILHMTNTGYGNRITGEILRTPEQSRREAERAAEIVGCNLVMLDFEEQKVPFDAYSVALVNSILDEREINIVYTNWRGDSHQDHIATFKCVMAAARYIDNVYLYEQIPQPRTNELHVEPTHFVDITKYFEIKIRAIEAHESQVKKYGDSVIDGVKSLARLRGVQCKRGYVEAFEVIKEVR